MLSQNEETLYQNKDLVSENNEKILEILTYYLEIMR